MGGLIPRSQIWVSDPTAVNSWEEEEEEKEEERRGEDSTVHGAGKWVGCETNSLQTPGQLCGKKQTRQKNLYRT